MILAKELEIIYLKQSSTLTASDYDPVHILFFTVIYIRAESKKFIRLKNIFIVNSQDTTLSNPLIDNQKKKVQNRLFIATLIQNIMVKIIDARNTIPVPQANVRSTPSKSMQ